ncbi:MAG TPA: hypothetical protein VFZ67_04255 [Nitrososphaera sp.]
MFPSSNARKMKMLNNNNNNNYNNNRKILLLDNIHLVTAATIFTLAIIFASSMTTTPVAASTTDENNTTATTTTIPSSGLELSPQPVWEERVATTGVTPINETHSIVDFDGNGTMTVPDTGETINMTNNGTAFVSPVAGSADIISAYGRENVFSEDGDDTTAITFYEIVQYQPEPFQGKGLVIAVFDRNATGSLAPFNGMMVVGTHEEQPNAEGTTITLWEWESGITLPPLPTTIEESPPSPMNTTTTTMTNATADINATAADDDEEEEQQQQTTPTIPALLLE